MNPDQFTYWLQGFVELTGGQMPEEEQWKSICDHLQTVFKKVTPPVGLPAYHDLLKRPGITSDPLVAIC